MGSNGQNLIRDVLVGNYGFCRGLGFGDMHSACALGVVLKLLKKTDSL